ncbi:GNAT family N-acetyltransferase [Silvanigrella paludirubra]|uniref:GNAT family N-acetyltransferase n=1 Tax=Silvanigrella paludirubra TaxID=2499159 RepID=A0A6N6VPA2_9BACT|nr:GNAT family N-acetyltransferase [Silvanigrella paludirubra]KAB8035857.1 GNAT family N-acetyltransferase [Silvanigrella paludirubra]
MKQILNYQVQEVNQDQYWDTYYKEFMQDFPEELTFIREGLLTKEQMDKRKNLLKMTSNISHHFILKDGDKAIALFRGEQKDIDVYYLRHGVVKNEYRKQGILSECLNKAIEFCKELGFVQITCCFVLSNNNILSQMIKKDFYLTSIECHAEYGQIGWLSHYLNEDLKRAFFFRCGMVEFSKKLLDNSEGNVKKFNKILNGF